MSRYKPYPAYKDSGVEWIGKVPEGWRIVPLKALAQIVNGATPESGNPKYWDGDIAWFTPADLDNENVSELIEPRRRITAEGLASCAARLTPAGSVILSTRAPVGSVGVTLIPSATNQGCRTLVTNPRILPKFLAEMLVAARSELSLRSNGTTFQELSTDSLASLRIPLAPLEEQTAIVSFLDRETARIDALIARKTEFIELLARKRQALITHAVTKGLDPNVKMKDSGVEWIGEVPEHWDISPFFTVAKEISRSNKGMIESKVLSLSFGRIIQKRESENLGLVPESYETYQIVEPGEIVFRFTDLQNDKNSLRSAQVKERGIITSAYLAIKPFNVNETYLAWLMRAYDHCKVFYTLGGGLRQSLKYSDVKRLPVVIPPLVEQLRSVDFIDRETARIDALIEKVQLSIDLLKKRRSALITAAVTGQIDLREST